MDLPLVIDKHFKAIAIRAGGNSTILLSGN